MVTGRLAKLLVLGMSSVQSVFGILASAVAVLGGLIYLTRALLRLAFDIRDNKNATVRNTVALKEFSAQIEGRMARIEDWIRHRDHYWR